MKLQTVAVAVLLVVGSANALAAEGPKNQLDQSYQLTVGEIIAIRLTTTINLLNLASSPATCVYDKDSKRIVINVFGASYDKSVDSGKRALETFHKSVMDDIIPFVNKNYGVDLGDTDFTLVYRVRGGDMKEILRREDGKYVVPD